MSLPFLWNECVVYKGIKIYPFLMKDYDAFEKLISLLLFDKNKIPDVQIIKMSYLRFLLSVVPQMSNEYGELIYKNVDEQIGELFKYIFKDNSVFLTYENNKIFLNFTESLDVKLDKIKKLIPHLKCYDVLYDIFKQLNQDDFKDILSLYHKIVSLANAELHKMNLFEAQQVAIFVDGIDEIINDNLVKLSEKDFDNIKNIVLKQNSIFLADDDIHPDLQKELDENRKFIAQKYGVKEGSIEDQIIAYKCEMKFESYEPIKNMTIYQFRKELLRLDLIKDYQIYKSAECSGFVEFKKPIPHWRSHIDMKPDYSDLLINRSEFEAKMERVLK